MRKLIVVGALVTTLVGTAGCATLEAWWQNFENNPAEQAQTIAQTAQVALNGAQAAWNTILPLIPQAAQAQANALFINAVATANHAITGLLDALTAAADAKQSNPNFAGAIAAVSDAVDQVLAIINQYTGAGTTVDGGAPTAAPSVVVKVVGPVPGYADLVDASKRLHRFAGKK